jgi:hypothetical protein
MYWSILWEFFLSWLKLFYAPFGTPDMLWIIIPIYLNWIFTEIFQEKKDTSLGNAISNGVIVFWVGIDWMRTTVRLLSGGHIDYNTIFYGKMVMAFMVFVYGLIIIYMGIKSNRNVRYIARIRQVSYVLIVFTPMFYGTEYLSLSSILACLVFFPMFYFFIEFLDWITPDPDTYKYN